jgi:hypothetical protein
MGVEQLCFSVYELTTANKQTKREKFLFEIEAVVPLQALIAFIELHDPKESKISWRPPYSLATMLRIHLLQQLLRRNRGPELCGGPLAKCGIEPIEGVLSLRPDPPPRMAGWISSSI